MLDSFLESFLSGSVVGLEIKKVKWTVRARKTAEQSSNPHTWSVNSIVDELEGNQVTIQQVQSESCG